MIQIPINRGEILKIVESFSLTDVQKKLVYSSFRTRAKYNEEGILEVQFKWMQDDGQENIEKFIQSISPAFEAYFSPQKVALTYKIGPCCEKDCLGCSVFGKN